MPSGPHHQPVRLFGQLDQPLDRRPLHNVAGQGDAEILAERLAQRLPRSHAPGFLAASGRTPLAAADLSEPEPDLAIAERTDGHPSTADLVIEVAVISQALDLQVKPAIYAAADVAECWVLDVPVREVVVHTDPGPTGYRMVRRQPWSQPLTVPVGDGPGRPGFTARALKTGGVTGEGRDESLADHRDRKDVNVGWFW